jgi:hypothetical protein
MVLRKFLRAKDSAESKNSVRDWIGNRKNQVTFGSNSRGFFMRIALVSLAALAVAAASPAAAQNLLQDGSFESGTLNAWTQSNGGGGTPAVAIQYGNSSQYPTGAFGEAIQPNGLSSLSSDPVGTWVAYFSSDTANPDSLSQTINLVKGYTYDVGFDYYAPANGIANPYDATLGFAINDKPQTTFTAGSGSGTPAQTWESFHTTYVASVDGPATFSFVFNGGGVTAADFAIDRVYVQAAVPEPATWAMMLVGFGGIGYAMRRRPKVKAAVSLV